MGKITEIFAPQANVNDDSVTIIEILVEEAAFVNQEDPVLLVETSKSTFEINAPVQGYIHFLVEGQQDVPIDQPLGILADTRDEFAQYERKITKPVEMEPGVAPIRAVPEYDPAASPDLTAIAVDRTQILKNQVTISQWLTAEHSFVDEGQSVCCVVAGNKVYELTTPEAGYLKFGGRQSDIIPVEAPIYWIGRTFDAVQNAPASPMHNPGPANPVSLTPNRPLQKALQSGAPPQDYTAFRLSRKASELIKSSEFDEQYFRSRLKGLIRSDDILRFIEPQNHHLAMATAGEDATVASTPLGSRDRGSAIIPGIRHESKKLTRSKRFEISLLKSASSSAIRSQVSTLVPTQGIFEACLNNPEFAGQMSTRILFEVSRLLKTYPVLNAGYNENHIVYYKEVNIGYAMDIDKGLKVPVFTNTDQMSLDELHRRKQQSIEKYLMDELTPGDLTGGTFTITDLSELDAWIFSPVINRGQAAILGIGSESGFGADMKAYPLILAFDHRLTEGKLCSEFLRELKSRMMAHERVLLKQMGHDSTARHGTRPHAICCQSCLKSLADIREQDDANVLLKTVGADGNERLICSICAGGW